jgi:hypothetical protein
MDNVKRFKYLILPELELIVENWIGEFSFDEILELKNQEASDPEWRDTFNVLADDRQTNFRIDALLKDNSKYFSLSQKFIKKRKTAILTSLPQQVATSVLLQLHQHPEALVKVEIFSTVSVALRWLNIDIQEWERINVLLNQLNK